MVTFSRRVLLLILAVFTMVTLHSIPSFAGPFVHSPIKSDEEVLKAKKPAPKPDPRKQVEALPTLVAVKHCVTIEGMITQPTRLIEAYNYQPALDDLPESITEADRERTMLYMMGRPDLPDFGFIAPEVWRTTPRDQRIRFNALALLKLEEVIGFKTGGYPFQGNCKPKMDGAITKKGKFEYARISMPMAFDVKEIKLTYVLQKQDGYNWQIDDLLVNNVGVSNYIKKDLVNAINRGGLPAATHEICEESEFPTLNCVEKNEIETPQP